MKFWFLRRLDLFEGLSATQMRRIGALLSERSCRTGEDVVVQPTGDRVYILKSGRVRVMNGDVAVTILEPGHLFGTAAFLWLALTGERIVALDDIVICEAPASQFLAEIAEHPPAAARIVRILAEQLLDLERAVERSATEAAPARLVDLLLRLARDREGRLEVRGLAESDLAGMIGASRETVSRLMAKWERAGLVRRAPRRVEIVDASALRASARS